MHAQLARNRRLDSFFVRNLNAEPDGWALPERSFDAVLCCVSVQYLQQVGGAAPNAALNQALSTVTLLPLTPSENLLHRLQFSGLQPGHDRKVYSRKPY